jgi:hypothetical protein
MGYNRFRFFHRFRNKIITFSVFGTREEFDFFNTSTNGGKLDCIGGGGCSGDDALYEWVEPAGVGIVGVRGYSSDHA